MLPLAVYGTLRTGDKAQEKSGLLGRLVSLGLRRLRGVLLDFGPYPGLVEGDGEVVVELLGVPDAAAWAVLDAYEDYYAEDEARSLYVRREVTTLEGERVFTYVYNQSHEGARVIVSGDWFDR